LLGRNGEGKSTLSKLLSNALEPMGGKIKRHNKLRIGFFAQHQVEELNFDETPLQHLAPAMPGVFGPKLRAKLAGFGLGADQADTQVGRLSGGQKARLSLLLATLDAPHLLILDEPTNHLDIESREALVEALTAYTGAVILVTHDMHLLSLVADRLWLVKDGHVTPYEDDLDTYRKLLLQGDDKNKVARKPKAKAKPAASAKRVYTRDEILALRSEARKCEQRMAKINEMAKKLEIKLADPALYDDKPSAVLWQKKYNEVCEAKDRAEELWMGALEKLEKAES
jgi:ATP-binding cassette subfamily F protein 3